MTDDSGFATSTSLDLSAVPLFPLPGVVLFPRAVLPLHVFEHRYRKMTADALAGDRLIAVALLCPGWERDYHGRPEIEPTVCVGRIINCQRFEDGKCNLLLQGLVRAWVAREHTDRVYRYAMLVPMRGTRVLEIDLSGEREKLIEMFSTRPLSQSALAVQFRQLLTGPMPTPDIADLIAFHYLEPASLKQRILSDVDVRRRVENVVWALRRLLPEREMLCGVSDDRARMN